MNCHVSKYYGDGWQFHKGSGNNIKKKGNAKGKKVVLANHGDAGALKQEMKKFKKLNKQLKKSVKKFVPYQMTDSYDPDSDTAFAPDGRPLRKADFKIKTK